MDILATDLHRICHTISLAADSGGIRDIDDARADSAVICHRADSTADLGELCRSSYDLPDSTIPALPSYELRSFLVLRTQAHDTAMEWDFNSTSSEGGNVVQDSTTDDASVLEELETASSKGGNVMQISKTDKASDVALTTTSKLDVTLTAREFISDLTAAAGDGLIITDPSFVNAVAGHCGLPTSSSAVSHLTSIDASFNIKIDDMQPLPKPPDALTTDGDKPNGGDYNCIKDTYDTSIEDTHDTSKSMSSKALRSAHETNGDGEMDHHLYTDVATMDKPCKPCFQTFIGGAIKIFVDAKGDVLRGL
ncbi:hypothetical protein NDA18_004643 [Ustilago nuda]|nr:hypothetical protein NDA18_004643 [Ustilago nuda]